MNKMLNDLKFEHAAYPLLPIPIIYCKIFHLILFHCSPLAAVNAVFISLPFILENVL